MVIKYIVVIVFVIVWIGWGGEIGFSAFSPLYTHFTYSLQHASIVHLILNSLVFISSIRTMEKFIRPHNLIVIIYIIAVLSSFAAMRDIPTVGSSGMIYAIFGMETIIVIFNDATTKQKRLFFSAIAFMLVMSFINNNSSFIVHISSFVLGALFWMIKREKHFHKHSSHTN